jgi:hypothetical protein
MAHTCSPSYSGGRDQEDSDSKPALVAHTCNHSYSGGRDQEDSGSKPAWAKNS